MPLKRTAIAIALLGCSSNPVAPFDAGADATPNETSTQDVTTSDVVDAPAPLPPTCLAANPNDNVADDDMLQACLDQGGVVRLEPGTPGYLLAKGLTVSKDGTRITSTSTTRARLQAEPALAAPLLTMTNRANVAISFLEFDGNRPARTGIATCKGYRIFGTNVAIEGSQNFQFTDNRSTHAMCGSALQVNGTSFEIARNLIDDNGHGREAVDAPEPWSDGITLGLCSGGNVHDNDVVDATDIAIVDGGGAGCQIVNNTIQATSRHAFAGIALHVFIAEGNGDHTGTVVKSNHISSGPGLMTFGLSIGMHSWAPTTTAKGGTVTNNVVTGALVDLQVDGVDGVTVSGNAIGTTSGAPGCGGTAAAYTTAHATTSNLQSGGTPHVYDGCIP